MNTGGGEWDDDGRRRGQWMDVMWLPLSSVRLFWHVLFSASPSRPSRWHRKRVRERESLWDDVEWIDHTQKGEGERLIDLPRSSSRVFRSKNLVSLSSFRQMTSRVLKRFEIAREANLHAKMFFLGWRIACFSSLYLLSYRVDKHTTCQQTSESRYQWYGEEERKLPCYYAVRNVLSPSRDRSVQYALSINNSKWTHRSTWRVRLVQWTSRSLFFYSIPFMSIHSCHRKEEKKMM